MATEINSTAEKVEKQEMKKVFVFDKPGSPDWSIEVCKGFLFGYFPVWDFSSLVK